mgnify:CR=1 FL=1
MKCEEMMDRYCQLDVDERLPLRYRVHMLFCSRCRHEVQYMEEKLVRFEGDFPFSMQNDASDTVMQLVRMSPVQYRKEVSSFKWLASGFVIFASIMLLPFSKSLSWLNDYFGGQLLFPLHVVMGILISVYAVLYVGTHLEELKDIMDNMLERIL